MEKITTDIINDTLKGIKVLSVTIFLWFLIEPIIFILAPLIIDFLIKDHEKQIIVSKTIRSWLLIIPCIFMIPTIFGIWHAIKNVWAKKLVLYIGWVVKILSILYFVIKILIFLIRIITHAKQSGLSFFAHIIFMLFFTICLSYLAAVFHNKGRRLLVNVSIILSIFYIIGDIIFNYNIMMNFIDPKVLYSTGYLVASYSHLIIVGITTLVLLRKYYLIIQKFSKVD